MAELAYHMRAQHSASLSVSFNDVETATRQMISTEERLVGAQMQVFHAMSQTSEHFREVDPNMSLVEFAALLPDMEQTILQDHISLYDEQIIDLTQTARLVASDSAQVLAVLGQSQETGGTYGRDGRRAGQSTAGTKGVA